MNDSEIVAAIRNLLAGGTTAPAPTATVAWWNPTPAQYASFAEEHGVPVSAIEPWIQQPNGSITGSPFPNLPPVSAKSEVLKYAGFGYKPNGHQAIFTEPGFTPRRKKCDELAKATTAAQADALVTGASACEPDAVRLALMTGLVSLNPFISPIMAGGQTVDEVIATLNYSPSSDPNAPGPSGR